MIKIGNVDVHGWETAVRGMRNPLNSWKQSDSRWEWVEDESPINPDDPGMMFIVGKNDLKLMKSLVKAGNDHAKFMRFITVTLDVCAPLYWWKEADAYKVGTVANSCSTMHKIADKEFTLDDFSHEHLDDESIEALERLLDCMNEVREIYLRGQKGKYYTIEPKEKEMWWQMIQLLPTSYNQRRTVLLNYAVLRNMYHARRNHKLDEWREFCKWIETLPHSELITEG